MKEKLTIRNFVGIDKLELDIGGVTVLIGPQSVGKSVCAKLLYIFRGIPNELDDETINHHHVGQIIVDHFLSFFSLESLNPDFLIRYEIDSQTIITLKRVGFDIPFCELSQGYMAESREIEQLYIPAGRSFFAMIQQNIFRFVRGKLTLDPFLLEFAAFYEQQKDQYPQFRLPMSPIFDFLGLDGGYQFLSGLNERFQKIIKGQYIQQDRRDYLVTEDKRQIPLASTSSGQQELVPLMVIFHGMFQLGQFPNYIYIEEAEAHIFPSTQKQLVEILAMVYNVLSKYGVKLFITTHSPYILTSLNNLIYAGELGKREGIANDVAQIVSQQAWLNFDDVQAYELNHNGATSLMSAEYRLIDTNILDAVSNELSEEFGELLDLLA